MGRFPGLWYRKGARVVALLCYFEVQTVLSPILHLVFAPIACADPAPSPAESPILEDSVSARLGGTVAPAAATQSGTLCGPVAAGHGSNTILFGPAKDFEDAPTQFGSVAFMYSPVKKVHSNLGYRINSVNGSRLSLPRSAFRSARAVS